MNFVIDDMATIGSILDALRTDGVKTGDIAKVIEGIGEKTLRSALKTAGYMFSNKAPKGWHYVGEDIEPLEKSIFDYTTKGEKGVKRISPIVHTQVIHSNADTTGSSPVIHPQFTQDEVRMITEMLYEWKQNKLERSEQKGIEEPSQVTQVHERIKMLQQGDKIRKTIVIDKCIGERLDAYCQKERVNKSDIMHLALIDFLDRYE